MIHYFTRLKKQMCDNWNKAALCDYGGNSITFGQLATQIARFHLLFESLGIKKGDKIALCAKNQARWGVAFLAANTYGSVIVPILDNFHPEGIARLVNHSASVMLFTDKELLKKLDTDGMPLVSTIVNVSDFSCLQCKDSDREIFDRLDDAFKEKYPEGFSSSDIDYPTDNDKDLSVINYTSGSTGEPKGVMLRYECFSANVEYGQKRIPSYPTDNILSILPLAHMFGMAFELVYPLCGGTTVYFLGKTPSPTLLLKAMAQVKPYLVIAVPMIFEKIYKSKLKPVMEKAKTKLMIATPVLRNVVFKKMRESLDQAFGGKVRMYIMGGAAVNPEVEAFLKKIKFHFTVGYGMTEAAPLLAYEDWDKFALRSCGKAIDSIQLRIDSEDPENVVGEIQAKGTNIFSGYYLNERATEAAFTEDGWFNTGDLGIIDASGNVFIKGRSKSMFLSSNGQNIYPEEIECLINSLDHVQESVVVSRDGKLVGLICLDSDAQKAGLAGDELAKTIVTTVNAELPRYSQLHAVEFRTEPFEKTPKMSIKRFLYK